MALGPALSQILEALHLDAEERAEMIDRASLSALAGMVRPISDRDEQASRRRAAGTAPRWSCRTPAAARRAGAADHEGGVEHVDGGDHARAPVGAGPGLHRREGRHDEEAAGDREAGEIDRDVDAAARTRRSRPMPTWRASTRRHAVRSTSRDRGRTGRAGPRRSASASRTMRPAASQAARPEPIAIAIEKIGETGRDDLLGAAEHVLHQRRQQRQRPPRRPARTSSSPARPTRCGGRRADG